MHPYNRRNANVKVQIRKKDRALCIANNFIARNSYQPLTKRHFEHRDAAGNCAET